MQLVFPSKAIAMLCMSEVFAEIIEQNDSIIKEKTMKFKLLKDLPGIKAGEIIEFKEDTDIFGKAGIGLDTDFCKANPDFFEEIKEEQPILVPDNIKIERGPRHEGIQFGDKQLLTYSGLSSYLVLNTINCFIEKSQLIPIDRKDLKPGDIAFRGALHMRNFISNYCIILDTKEYVFPSDTNILTSVLSFKNWYKVIHV